MDDGQRRDDVFESVFRAMLADHPGSRPCFLSLRESFSPEEAGAARPPDALLARLKDLPFPVRAQADAEWVPHPEVDVACVEPGTREHAQVYWVEVLEQNPHEAEIRAGFWGGIFCGHEYHRTIRFVEGRWIVSLGERTCTTSGPFLASALFFSPARPFVDSSSTVC